MRRGHSARHLMIEQDDVGLLAGEECVRLVEMARCAHQLHIGNAGEDARHDRTHHDLNHRS